MNISFFLRPVCIIIFIFFTKIAILKCFELEIFMHVTDQREIEFPDGNKYVQLEGSANWKDTQGGYGVINCLATITTKAKKKSAILYAYCEGKNQNQACSEGAGRIKELQEEVG